MPSNNELVSVIMPCFNSARFVAESIGSVFSQSYLNIELIVIDDGSEDNSLEILTQLAEQHIDKLTVLRQPNLGPYPARNLGLSHAKGEYIAFLDSDDYWDKEFVSRLYSSLQENSADVAYCGWQNVGDVKPERNKPYLPPAYEESDLFRAFLEGCPWPIHAALIKRKMIEKIGGFSERYFTSLDYDLWIRLLTVTQKIIRVPEVLAFYRWHGSGQISSVKARQSIDAWNVRRDFVRNNRELISHIPKSELHHLVNKSLLNHAYTAYWKRDFDTARPLFFKSFLSGHWSRKDAKYIAICLLPDIFLTKLTSKSNNVSKH